MEWKTVNIFISSTFNDMHAERDYLVKNVFPELAEWCEDRKLRLIDIDLRWGITKADSEANNTVKKCLEGIDRCRPFFLCFLGQRRGWVPTKDETGKVDSVYRDDDNFFGNKSVTEIEIEHALLAPMYDLIKERKPNPAKHALFFFRENPFEENLDEAHRILYKNDGVIREGKNVLETDGALETFKNEVREKRGAINYNCRWNPKGKTPELRSEDNGLELSNGRIVDFKIQRKNIPEGYLLQLKKFYPSIADDTVFELKYVVLAGLIDEILSEFPDRESIILDVDDRYAVDLEQQEIFLHNTLEGFVPVPDIPEQLDGYIEGVNYIKNIPLLLTANAGLGKTTLLAQWVKESRENGKCTFVRFCGISDLASEQYDLWDSIFHERNIQAPSTLDELQQKIEQLLLEFSAKGDAIIVIDAIDQLPDGLNMLSWIPRSLPDNLFLIISAKSRDDEFSLLETHKSVFNHVSLLPVDEAKKKELIGKYLEKSLKALDDVHIAEICGINPENKAQQKASENPLYLKILLSELRIFGAFKQLGDQIKQYGNTPFDAFIQVFKRLEDEQTYDTLPPKEAVPFLFGLLCNARHGLTENELAFCLGEKFGKKDSVRGTIRYFIRQVRPFISSRSGRIDFLYDEFRKAAIKRFSDLKSDCNLLLVNCFLNDCDPDKNYSFNSDNIRALVELGYHTTEYNYAGGERLYSKLAYLDARCSNASTQLLLTELNRFESNICRGFFNIILRFQAILSNYPNSLFSICRAEKSSPVYLQTETLLSDGSWAKTWIDTKQLFLLQDTEIEAEEQQPSFSLKLIAESEQLVFNEACAFSPDAAILVFPKTLEQIHVFDMNAFDMLSCVIHVQPIRSVSVQFSFDSKYLAVTHEDTSIELFRLMFNQEGQLVQAVNMSQNILSYKPKRGFSSCGFSNRYFCFQPNENTIRAFDLTTSSFLDLFQTEQPFILDAVVPINDVILFSLRQGMYSAIYCYSHVNKVAERTELLEGAFARCSCTLNENHVSIGFSDNQVLIFDLSGNIVAERKLDATIKSICNFGQKLFILCHSDELLLWEWAANCIESVYVEKNENQHLNNVVSTKDNGIMAILGASIAKFEMGNDHKFNKAKKQIISMDEIPELIAAVSDGNNGISIQRNDSCSETIRLEKNTQYSACLTVDGTYLLSEYGRGYYLAPNQKLFEPIKEIGQTTRILKYCAATDGCVYYIDTLGHFCCGQSNFTYDLSRYQLSIFNMRALGNYVLLFGTAHGAQATQNASTGHEPLTGTLLIFQIIRTGLLCFCGERLFSAKYGIPIDAAFHPNTEQIYLMFNTPHSAKSKDFLHVCFGTKEEFISGKERHADVNIGRRGDNIPNTACAADSYLICYVGNVYAYDAMTLKYLAAIATNSSFNRLQITQHSSEYALALCNDSTEIKQIIINKKRKED